MKPHDQAQKGLNLLKEAILGILAQKSDGLRNAEIAEILEIHSDYMGEQKDYLSWSVLGLLLNEGKVVRKDNKYFVAGKEEQ
jgi:hypothetical protein